MKAQCQCGQLSAELPGSTDAVVACHCIDCQRRTGAPFRVLAYYPAEQVQISGEAKQFTRPTATGGTFDNFFCPHCGSSVYVRAGKHPDMLGISVGAIADADFSAPARSVWEQSMHRWVEMPEGLQHFAKGRG